MSEGIFGYFLKWLGDEDSHKTIDNSNEGIIIPSSVESVRRYGDK